MICLKYQEILKSGFSLMFSDFTLQFTVGINLLIVKDAVKLI